jgi:hypothetical protein
LIPSDSLEVLELGQRSRQDLKDFSESLPAPNLDTLKHFEFVGWSLKATPKKIIMHVLTHELRQWGPNCNLAPFERFWGDFHDFIFNPVLGGESKASKQKRPKVGRAFVNFVDDHEPELVAWLLVNGVIFVPDLSGLRT